MQSSSGIEEFRQLMSDTETAHTATLRETLLQIAPLPEQEITFLLGHSHLKTYAGGKSLISAGDVAEQCWFLGAGFLRFYYITENGREFNKAFSRPGEIILPLTSFVSGQVNGFHIDAITDVETLAFPVRIIPALFERHPLWERVGRVLAEQMAMRKELRERELLLDSALARYERFAERYPELAEWLPQRQIASYIGITEQALSRLLHTRSLNKG